MGQQQVDRSGEMLTLRQLVLLLLLTLVVVVSAVGVAYSRFQTRHLFVEVQALQNERDNLLVRWDQLQIEEAYFADHATIEKKARESLGMTIPPFESVEHISP